MKTKTLISKILSLFPERVTNIPFNLLFKKVRQDDNEVISCRTFRDREVRKKKKKKK